MKYRIVKNFLGRWRIQQSAYVFWWRWVDYCHWESKEHAISSMKKMIQEDVLKKERRKMESLHNYWTDIIKPCEVCQNDHK